MIRPLVLVTAAIQRISTEKLEGLAMNMLRILGQNTLIGKDNPVLGLAKGTLMFGPRC